MRGAKSIGLNLGKALLNLGQGLILGAFLSGFLKEDISPLTSFVVLSSGIYTLLVGLYVLAKVETSED